MTRLARHQPRNVLPPDDGSAVLRLTAEIKAAGWRVVSGATGRMVSVWLEPVDGECRNFRAPTLAEALRKARAWALGGGS